MDRKHYTGLQGSIQNIKLKAIWQVVIFCRTMRIFLAGYNIKKFITRLCILLKIESTGKNNLRNEIIFDDKNLSTEKKYIRITSQTSRFNGRINQVSSHIPITRSEFFLLHPKNPFSEEEKKLLKNLLFGANTLAKLSTIKDGDAVQSVSPNRPSKGNIFYVAPRRGTCSPWSSKTQDILKNIFPSLKDWRGGGLIERGYGYTAPASSPVGIDEFKRLICDQMTQEVLPMEELGQYFIDHEENNTAQKEEARKHTSPFSIQEIIARIWKSTHSNTVHES